MYQTPVQEIHPPALQALERMMEEALALDADITRRAEGVTRSRQQTEASAWTTRIEANLDNPDGLEFLRVERREALILSESLLFGFYSMGDRLGNVQRDLFEAIKLVVEQAASEERHSADAWLRPILVNAALRAEEIRRRRPMFVEGSIPNRVDADRDSASLAALKGAFAEVAEFVKSLRTYSFGNQDLRSSLQQLYPLEGAVTPAAIGKDFKRDEMRACPAQPFLDTVNDKHPALQKLSDLLSALDIAVRKAREAANALRSGEKGKVNERQYANRLLNVLDGTPGTCGYAGPKAMKDEQERQKRARVMFESQRIVVYSELVAAEALRREVLATLREAVVECEELERQIGADRCATTDKLFTRRLALINCIAADVQLRQAGRSLVEVAKEYENDVTSGKGATQMATEFAELKRYYDSFKRLGGDTKSGGGSD